MEALVGDVRFSYDIGGDGDEPMVLIGAEGLGRGTFEAVLPFLNPRFKLLTYDQRGHGGSDLDGADPVTVQSAADDLAAVLDAAGWQKAHVQGSSFGAQVALSFAQSRPERCTSLILSACHARGDVYTRYMLDALIDHAEVAGINRGVAAFLAERNLSGEYLEAHPEVVDDTVLRLLQTTPAPSFLATLRASQVADLSEGLSGCAVPALVLAGEKDRVLDLEPSGLDARRLAESLPHGRLEILPGAGHFTTIECPREHADAVIAFADALVA